MRELGARLRAAGLTPKLLRAWAGTDRAASIHARYAGEPRAGYGARLERVAPAEAALALFVAGADLPGGAARALPIAALAAAGLVDVAGERVRATVALLPVGEALVACDRLDAPVARELACWPDDSSHHLASALPPGRRPRWLDLGCGSAFAPLARPEVAEDIVGLDANPRACERARLGAALSGRALTVLDGDLAAGVPDERYDLVTCNAPMPHPDATLWRSADAGFFPALFAAVPRLVAPGGLAVLHLARAALPDELPGEVVAVAYAGEPPGEQVPPGRAGGFAVVWWQPGAPARYVSARRDLTVERPHLQWRDREDALC
ncbi:MAG: methyltransferase [Deltaproteobacteria bacterium]|nr:methyltransferase [Deltaproteobacteria bacterium]